MNARTSGLLALSLAACFAMASDLSRDEILKAEGYIRPSANIEQAVLAPWASNINGGTLNPQNTLMLVSRSRSLTPVEEMGKPHVILGGFQIDTVAERDRTLTTRSLVGISVMDVTTGRMTAVSVPKGLEAYGPRWSPDGKSIAFVAVGEKETSLYVADAATGKSKKVVGDLRMTEVTSFDWLADSKRLVVPVKPQNLQAPALGPIALGPRVRLSDTKKDQFSTFPSLLQNPEETAYLKYLLTAQIGIVDASSGSLKRVGSPMMLTSFDAGPNAKAFIVRSFEGEFSYMRPAGMGAQKQVLLDENGKEIAVLGYSGTRSVEIKKEDQPPSRSGLSWRPDGKGLSYMRDEELPKDSKEKAKKQLVLWKAPFGKDDIEVVYEDKDAFSLVGYGSDLNTVFISKTVGKKTEFYIFKMGDSPEPKKMWETTTDTDFYNQPGVLMFDQSPGFGRVVKMAPGNSVVYFSGTSYYKNPEEEAPRPFVDRLDLTENAKPIRIWQSAEDKFETAQMLDDNGESWLVNRQSPTMVPQLFLVKHQLDRQITQNMDYLPDVTQAETRRIKVRRDDGIEFMISVLLPQGTSMDKLPAFIWFYPTEFTTQKVYDESLRTYNKNAFRRLGASSVQLMVRDGYAVVDADFPITGEATEANNTFPHQLRMNFTAIVDALTEQCGVDRNKMAIGGHSYGAFGTANALVHTSFFKAGIAGDGNYNRTLTPFGFQRESRTLWQAREVYSDMSAMLHAEQINGALLMYHGIEDQNVGTNPINSERMFAALEALGKPSALYMYPYEDHGPIGLETRLDMWARWMAWLDKYVKNPEAPKKEEAGDKTPPPGLTAWVDLRG